MLTTCIEGCALRQPTPKLKELNEMFTCDAEWQLARSEVTNSESSE